MTPPYPHLMSVCEKTGQDYKILKASDYGVRYVQEYMRWSKRNEKFDPFRNDPNCKTCGKK